MQKRIKDFSYGTIMTYKITDNVGIHTKIRER